MNPHDLIPVKFNPDPFNAELPVLSAAPGLPSKTPGPVRVVPAYQPDWALLQDIYPYLESPIHE